MIIIIRHYCLCYRGLWNGCCYASLIKNDWL